MIPEDVTLSDTEIDQLVVPARISRPPTEVSNLSGRGVGMDVVKTQITSLGGRVVPSNPIPGVGTNFRHFSAAYAGRIWTEWSSRWPGETLVIPLNAIVETLSLGRGRSETRGGRASRCLCVREQFVPVLDLGVELGYRQVAPMQDGTIALLISPEEGVLVALLGRHD